MADNGRNPDEIKVFPTLQAIVGKDHEEVADQIIEWIDNDGADGFVLTPHILGDFFHDFIDKVIPILVDKGYYNTSYEGKTLRDEPGLPFKENRYTK